MNKESQRLMILRDLLTGVKITGLDAIKRYGCIKASNRMSELIAEGFNIQKEWIEITSKQFGKKRVIQYSMKP